MSKPFNLTVLVKYRFNIAYKCFPKWKRLFSKFIFFDFVVFHFIQKVLCKNGHYWLKFFNLYGKFYMNIIRKKRPRNAAIQMFRMTIMGSPWELEKWSYFWVKPSQATLPPGEGPTLERVDSRLAKVVV